MLRTVPSWYRRLHQKHFPWGLHKRTYVKLRRRRQIYVTSRHYIRKRRYLQSCYFDRSRIQRRWKYPWQKSSWYWKTDLLNVFPRKRWFKSWSLQGKFSSPMSRFHAFVYSFFTKFKLPNFFTKLGKFSEIVSFAKAGKLVENQGMAKQINK